MKEYPNSARILAENRQYIPGGAVSLNRVAGPDIVFVRGAGSRLHDADGNEYIDYHAAFAPHFLGHNDPYVNEAVDRAMRGGASLYGSGTTELEGRLARMVCEHVPCAESAQILNTGSEATYQALRAARGITGRDHVIVMQGGYNGWHNDVACNLMTPLAQIGPRISPGEYPFLPISAGIPKAHQALVHPVNFNDLDSVRWVCERYPIAALITEPILQNIGVVHPQPGYLAGLRALADEFGFVLIFDEVKTGFRHGLGGYAAIAGVEPDMAVFGKAIANGYPIAVLAGKRRFMDVFADADPVRRVLLAGTYNGHPSPTMAAIATIERLRMDDGAVYRHTDRLGALLEAGVLQITRELGIPAAFRRQGSAFCLYFMDHAPVDWHDLAGNHPFAADDAMRHALIERGIYFFPLATKQGSISAAHTEDDIARTLEAWAEVLALPAIQQSLPASSAR
ncbi:MAG: aspartate aminotransferase family protein [Bryobacterales bacterium]|nr:aspartate aminotransferase family protein [Bryobacterales bacterium]